MVIGTGGFAGGPLLYMAIRMNIPSLIQEQNALPGNTNRFLGKHVNHIALHIKSSIVFQVQKHISQETLYEQSWFSFTISTKGQSKDEACTIKNNLLVVGGSLGSKRMNELMAVHCDRITQMGVQIVWQCGSLYKRIFAIAKK